VGSKPGFVYHVINRGNGRATIFHKAQDYFWLAPVPNVPDVQWFDRLTMSGSIFRSS
jgi:hypothetical protein